MSKAGKRLIEAAREMSAIARGEAAPAHLHIPADIDVKGIRRKVGLSQEEFASAFCFTSNQIRDWEQARSRPTGGVRAYLLMIDQEPEAVMSLLAKMAASRKIAA